MIECLLGAFCLLKAEAKVSCVNCQILYVGMWNISKADFWTQSISSKMPCLLSPLTILETHCPGMGRGGWGKTYWAK